MGPMAGASRSLFLSSLLVFLPGAMAVLQAGEAGSPPPHWAFVPAEQPEVPQVRDPSWVRNPIDAFVLARLESEGVQPSAQADRSTLIRRLSLDLVGLPPSPEEVEHFLEDSAPKAYERLVDRLLDSPHYGEKWARHWLDLARYADTDGYETDNPRPHAWRWRHWVIEAFNRNLPFDQFTIEQLAGDMLPEATLDQIIATGFNRNHRANGEGGVIADEYLVEYVVDRVDTTATVWLGLTLGCARCHEHKYDPISQQEFYEVFAFFNNVPERGKTVKYGNSPPFIPAPTAEQGEELAEVDRSLAAAKRTVADLRPRLEREREAWANVSGKDAKPGWTISDSLLASVDFEGILTNSAPQSSKPDAPPAIAGSPEATFVAGLTGQAIELNGTSVVEVGDVANFGYFSKFSLAAWISADDLADGSIISRCADIETTSGYELRVANGKLQANLVRRWLDDGIRVATVDSLTPKRWHHVAMTYDGSRLAAGVKIYVDGKSSKLKIALDDLQQTFDQKEKLRIGGRGNGSKFQGRLDNIRVYDRVLTPVEMRILATRSSLPEISATPTDQRSEGQQLKLERYFVEKYAAPEIRDAFQLVTKLQNQRSRLIESFPTVMVMVEREERRPTFFLERGQYDHPGDPVEPGLPDCLSPPSPAPRNRLELARWLVNPSNPLSARVTVNRYWQSLFGAGLVRTPEDFGTRGESPTHPALLDWLANEFIRIDRDVKALLRLIVNSATYRQSSTLIDSLLARDPENRLLGRAPRPRLGAQALRDQALALSGLLFERIGGPSVRPYQPAGLWKEVSAHEYKADRGANLYRRSLYTFWKRTVAPPTMMSFDATTRELCTVRLSRTNTPLQALTLLNEVSFIEAARCFAERVMHEGGKTLAQRAEWAFRAVTARGPKSVELAVILEGYRNHLAAFRAAPQAAADLVNAGDSKPNASLDVSELAAWTAIANLLLNLDEVMTRG